MLLQTARVCYIQLQYVLVLKYQATKTPKVKFQHYGRLESWSESQSSPSYKPDPWTAHVDWTNHWEKRERERETECVTERERERERESVWVRGERQCVCVCVCVRERDSVCVCVWCVSEWERQSVCERERVRERERVCVCERSVLCVWERERESGECVRERERETQVFWLKHTSRVKQRCVTCLPLSACKPSLSVSSWTGMALGFNPVMITAVHHKDQALNHTKCLFKTSIANKTTLRQTFNSVTLVFW